LPSAPIGYRPLLHPFHAILLAFPISLFSFALVTDITYLRTAEIQWSNFASWSIVAALIGGGAALAWSLFLIIAVRRLTSRWRVSLYAILLAIMWIAGLLNAFQHSQDAWSSVGTTGLLLSIISTISALTAGWVGHGAVREIV
jgi:uncharacterized membrane protein